MSYFSFCPYLFKINSVKTLLFRAYSICTTYFDLHNEFQFLIDYFCKNGFPKNSIENSINNLLEKMNSDKSIAPSYDVPKKLFYISFPFFGHQSIRMKYEIELLLGKYFPHLDVRIILVNNFTIGSFFNCKDTIPVCLRANIVYSFSCVQSARTSEYIGSSTRCLTIRACEHMGISFRTKYPVTKPPHSAIREHYEQCGNCDLTLENFRILDTAKDLVDLRILESIYIAKRRPVLNNMQSAFPLVILSK